MFNFDKLAKRLKNHERNILGHETAVRSAVLIPLVKKNGEWHVLFEVRSQLLKRQPGEICFPGGKVEKEESDAAAAVRETCEELRIQPAALEVLGSLDILVQSPFFFVYPYVGVIEDPAEIDPNEEVEEVFTVPISWLAEQEPELHYLEMKIEPDQNFPFDLIPNGENYNWRRQRKPEYFYRYGDYVIWGLTARILVHFLNLANQ
ncbi:MAG TPA: CoA pyrophosphatase [Bacillales bacterium]|nr:CoA pyrophosphatase [Bacillales bacterium]